MMKRYVRGLVDRLAERIAQSTARRMSGDIEELRNSVNMLRLTTILNSTPEGTPPRRLFDGVDDEFWFWVHTEGYRRSELLRQILPGVPDEKTQLRYVGAIGDDALRRGLNGSRVFKELYEDMAGDFSACRNVLDFGCGWGRVIRFFLKDIDHSKLWGIDVSEKAVKFCQQSFKWCNFSLVDPFRPTEFSDGQFDFIYAFSVFSHLSEDMQRRWLEELERILAPGGVIVATTWGREFITRCREMRKAKDLNAVTKHLPTMFRDTEHWLSLYDQGSFCFDSSPESYGAVSEWLGEACISRRYVENHWARRFSAIQYIDQGPHRQVISQNIIVARK